MRCERKKLKNIESLLNTQRQTVEKEDVKGVEGKIFKRTM